jgi:hypothetical protein
MKKKTGLRSMGGTGKTTMQHALEAVGKPTTICIDDLPQQDVDALIQHAISTGSQITIDITPMVDRRLKADRAAARRKR